MRSDRVAGWSARGVAASLLDYALPPSCAGCGREGEPLCGRCVRPLASRLSLPPGVPIGLPAGMPMPLAQLEWCAPFAGMVRRALHQLKYSGERRLAMPLGDALAARWHAAGAGGDLFVPVPIHAERARRRGYDQAQLLSDRLAWRLGMLSIRSLERTRATTPQFDLGREARRQNVRDAFAVPPGTRDAVRERWIVLVDDVVTTGSTLVSCAEALLASGASGVSAITVARER